MAWQITRTIFKVCKSCTQFPHTPSFPLLYQTWKYHSTSSPCILLDPKTIYSGMTSRELITTFLTLFLVAKEPVVDAGIKLLSSRLMNHSLLRAPIFSVVKKTCYSHFCAGENLDEASRTLQRMWELGLRGILNYSLEDAMDNPSCDRNLQVFQRIIHQTPLLPPGSVSFSCVKITALCPIPLLHRVSDLLRWQHKKGELNLPWKEDSLPMFAAGSPAYHVQDIPEPLTQNEENDLMIAKQRVWKICKESEAAGLPLLVDAEYTSVQPAIDYLTYAAAVEFNKGRQPLVYGTIQAYLKDSLERLTIAIAEASNRGVTLGIKLVRGAYLSRESSMAAQFGTPSPIHSGIQNTHKSYDACAAFMLEKAAQGKGSIVIATHNFNSGRAAATKAEELGMKKSEGGLEFAQIKGMADGLSMGLVQAGFKVSKYLAFGPVDHVMPYLIRRAEENKGVLSATIADRDSIREELARRFLEATGSRT